MVERKSRNNIVRTCFVGLLSVIIIVLMPIQGAVRAQQGHQENAERQMLALKITASENKVCRGTCLKVEAEITNIADENITVDAKGLIYRISVEKVSRTSKGASIRSFSIQGDYGPEQYNESGYYVLKPRESHKDSFTVSLRDDFFRDDGSYTITTTYGQFRKYIFRGVEMFEGTVKSNEIEFNIVRCNSGEVKKLSRNCE